MKRSDKKEYIVIGLGRFGTSVARQLEANGCSVLAVDHVERRVNLVADYVTRAVCVDITDEEAMEELGLGSFDGAVIAMGHNLEAAIFATIWAKEKGVSRIVAKAYDEMQGKILRKVGADDVVYPEREMGLHLANNLSFGNMLETVELASDYAIAEVPVLREWVGHTFKELRIREKYQVSVIAVKHNGRFEIVVKTDEPILDGDVFVLIGTNAAIKDIAGRI